MNAVNDILILALYNYLTLYYVLYITMYFGPVAFMYKINDLSWVEGLDVIDAPLKVGNKKI